MWQCETILNNTIFIQVIVEQPSNFLPRISVDIALIGQIIAENMAEDRVIVSQMTGFAGHCLPYTG
jgi:hypothetical protein